MPAAPPKSSTSPSATWMNSTSARSATAMPRPTRWPKMRPWARRWASPAAASDADATNNTITYSLDDDAGGLFAIDANTGVVTVNGGTGLRDGHQPQHHGPGHQQRRQLRHRRALRSTSPTSTKSGVSAISDTDAAADFVLENATPGTVVGVTAFADDADGTDTVSYSLDDDAGGRSPSTPPRAS